MRCNACEVLTINGVRCHETGCPEAYKDEIRECNECGDDFAPEHKRQELCCGCWESLYGTPDAEPDYEPRDEE